MKSLQKVVDVIFRDKNGKLSLFEWPSLPLIVGLVSYALSKVLPYGQANFLAALIAFGALFTWAWLEIFIGKSYFRRALGVMVMLILLISHL